MINTTKLNADFASIKTITRNDFAKADVYAKTEAEARYPESQRRNRRYRYYGNLRKEIIAAPERKASETPRYAVIESSENDGTRNYPDFYVSVKLVELIAVAKSGNTILCEEDRFTRRRVTYNRILAWVK